MERLDTMEDLEVAANRLAAVEPRFSDVVSRNGLPRLRHAEPALRSLLRIVTDQLISLKAGEAIWNRLAGRLGNFAPDEVLALSEAELRSLGLSGAKARTFHAAARAFAAGHLDGADQLEEPDIYRRLTAISGVGPWTANIYLLMVLKAADAWPAADIALQSAAQNLLSLPSRPSSSEMVHLGESWRPYRSTAALLLWSHYRGLRAMPQV